MTGREEDLPGGAEADAAEYALGVLPEPEREAFEARLAAEPDLAQDVAVWTEYFSTLVDHFPAREPPPAIFRRIEAALHGPPRKPRWRLLLPYLVGAVAGATMAWVAMISGVLLDPEGQPPDVRAELTGDMTLAVRFDPPGRTLAVDLTDGAAPEGRVLELWLIPAGRAPLSLGVLGADGRLVRVLPALLAEHMPGAVLAVTDEPTGGAPDGAPTGKIRARGAPLPS